METSTDSCVPTHPGTRAVSDPARCVGTSAEVVDTVIDACLRMCELLAPIAAALQSRSEFGTSRRVRNRRAARRVRERVRLFERGARVPAVTVDLIALAARYDSEKYRLDYETKPGSICVHGEHRTLGTFDASTSNCSPADGGSPVQQRHRWRRLTAIAAEWRLAVDWL